MGLWITLYCDLREKLQYTLNKIVTNIRLHDNSFVLKLSAAAA
jgi:hypothetical protein